MKKFVVEGKYTTRFTNIVYANSEEEALEKVDNMDTDELTYIEPDDDIKVTYIEEDDEV